MERITPLSQTILMGSTTIALKPVSNAFKCVSFESSSKFEKYANLGLGPLEPHLKRLIHIESTTREVTALKHPAKSL